MKPVCYCRLDSPFRWKDCPRPSIFADDPVFKAKGKGNPTKAVNPEEPPVRLTAEDRFLAVTRLRMFHVYNRAGFESFSEREGGGE